MRTICEASQISNLENYFKIKFHIPAFDLKDKASQNVSRVARRLNLSGVYVSNRSRAPVKAPMSQF
jgi:hypothetical protein